MRIVQLLVSLLLLLGVSQKNRHDACFQLCVNGPLQRMGTQGTPPRTAAAAPAAMTAPDSLPFFLLACLLALLAEKNNPKNKESQQANSS